MHEYFKVCRASALIFIKAMQKERLWRSELSWREVLLAQLINLQNTYVVNDVDKMTFSLISVILDFLKRSHVLLKCFLFLMKNGPFSRNLKVYPDFLLPRKCVIICPNSKRFCPEKRQNDSKIFKNTVKNFLILCGSCPSLEVSLMCSNGVSRSCNFSESLKQI